MYCMSRQVSDGLASSASAHIPAASGADAEVPDERRGGKSQTAASGADAEVPAERGGGQSQTAFRDESVAIYEKGRAVAQQWKCHVLPLDSPDLCNNFITYLNHEDSNSPFMVAIIHGNVCRDGADMPLLYNFEQ